jgi:hypothetical protein
MRFAASKDELEGTQCQGCPRFQGHADKGNVFCYILVEKYRRGNAELPTAPIAWVYCGDKVNAVNAGKTQTLVMA